MKNISLKLLLCLTLLLSAGQISAQVKHFEKYAKTEDIVYVYVSRFMLRLVGDNVTPSVPGVNTKGLVGKLRGLQIITAESEQAAKKLHTETQAYVNTAKYELMMQVDEEDNEVAIYFGEDRRQSVLIMLTNSDDDEATVIVFSGKFTGEDIEKMIEAAKK